MADTAIAITAGSGTNVDTRTEGTNGNHRQVVVLGDPSTNAGVAAVDATNGLSVNVTNAALLNGVSGEYETVAASQTAQVIGPTGGTGDYIRAVVIVPASVSPGVVTLLDNAISIPLFAGGTNSLTELKPIVVPLGMVSVSGAWKITTGANVSVIAIGNFT